MLQCQCTRKATTCSAVTSGKCAMYNQYEESAQYLRRLLGAERCLSARPIRNMFQYQIVSSTQNAVPNLTSGSHAAGTPLAGQRPPATGSTNKPSGARAN